MRRGRGQAADCAQQHRSAFNQATRGGVPAALPLSFWPALPLPGRGWGAPVHAPPAGGARPTRPLALRGSPLPALRGGGAAARPVCRLRQHPGKCGGWSPPPSRLAAAAAVQRRRRLRSARLRRLPAASRCTGHPSRKARPRQAACGVPCFAPSPRRLRRWCSGAARPPRRGGCGAVRASGPGVGTPASVASHATPTAQAWPLPLCLRPRRPA